MKQDATEMMLPLVEVLRRTALSKAELDALVAAKQFPEPTISSEGNAAWPRSVVNAWLLSLPRTLDIDGEEDDASGDYEQIPAPWQVTRKPARMPLDNRPALELPQPTHTPSKQRH